MTIGILLIMLGSLIMTGIGAGIVAYDEIKAYEDAKKEVVKEYVKTEINKNID